MTLSITAALSPYLPEGRLPVSLHSSWLPPVKVATWLWKVWILKEKNLVDAFSVHLFNSHVHYMTLQTNLSAGEVVAIIKTPSIEKNLSFCIFSQQ